MSAVSGAESGPIEADWHPHTLPTSRERFSWIER